MNAEYVESADLREVEVMIFSQKVCTQQGWYGDNNPHYNIGKTMICAGHAVGKKDSCTGDSGGPLQCLRPDGRWKLAGLTSWGWDPCAKAQKPGVYTKIAAYIGWIRKYVDGRTYGLLIVAFLN